MRTIGASLTALFVTGALAACTGQATVRTRSAEPVYTEPVYTEPVYKPEPEPLYTDAEIHQELALRLAEIPGLDLDSVTFHVHEGAVHFQGHVHSNAAMQDLQSVALSVPGVRHIDTADLHVR